MGELQDRRQSRRESTRDGSRRRSPERSRKTRERSPSGMKDHRSKRKRRDELDGGMRESAQEEVEKRRRRIEAWQMRKRQLSEKPEKNEDEDALENKEDKDKGWNLEDEGDLSSEGEGQDDVAGIHVDMGHLPRLGELEEKKEKETDGFDELMKDTKRHGKQNGAAKEMEVNPLPGKVKEEDTGGPGEEDDVDPLDAFMQQQVLPEVQKESENGMIARHDESVGDMEMSKPKQRKRRYDSDESDLAEHGDENGGEEEMDDAEWARRVQAGKLSKGDKLGVIDHSKVSYPTFRRNFYIEVPELAKMTDDQVQEFRKKLDDIKVRGKHVPKPIKNWTQAGLSGRIIEVLRKSGFESPLPIQAQAIPVIMGGRDCIGVAKTGSGKTLAFVLPMLRHVKDQPPLVQGDGPIGMIMAPTRELITQIGKEVKRFAKAVGIGCTCVYGGSGIANQISELKRGTEIVVCTPGRMIDILASGAGKITNLQRVTFLVMDEADRMFDMGFEPQIMRIVNNIRPDRQTVLFSATFPRSVELLARKVLTNPVEIQLGGRSVVNADITQKIEIRPEEDRFLRLLQLLGEWYEKGKLLVFVSSQDRCDTLFRDLLRAGYPCLSLHGGKDQADRESTISDFKSSVCNVLVATSVAARGLDVKDLVLVVNYDCPNHHEEYVHRVGRTGRAGRKGTAVTFIGPDEEQYAPDLVKALTESHAAVPNDLAVMANRFTAKKKAGLVKAHASGFGGSGFKFDKEEDEKVKSLRKSTAKEYGILESSESEDEDIKETTGASRHEVELSSMDKEKLDPTVRERIKAAQALATRFGSAPKAAGPSMEQQPMPANPALAAAQAAAKAAAQQLSQKTASHPSSSKSKPPLDITAAAQAAVQALTAPTSASQTTKEADQQHYGTELEINDFPQQARWKITHRDTINAIGEQFSAAVVVRGRYFKPGTQVPEGERKLYLIIEGPSTDVVKKAKAEIKKILEESTEKAMRREAPALM
eukprot:jgi/Picsp_1/4724/NSC_02093-R1_dead-box atp-dependent rna helicase 42-like